MTSKQKIEEFEKKLYALMAELAELRMELELKEVEK